MLESLLYIIQIQVGVVLVRVYSKIVGPKCAICSDDGETKDAWHFRPS